MTQAMATPNYILPPGVTVPRSLVTVSAPPSTLTDVDSFLMNQNRRTHNVLPDGNCMFRALSHQIYGKDNHHEQVLLYVIQSTYQHYWIENTPWGKVTFDEHLQRLANVGSWSTQLELQAVSDCYNVRVFVCSPNNCGITRWEVKATPKHHSNIHIPGMSTLPFTNNAHIELCYNNYHYMSVLPTGKGVQLLPPVIIPRHSDTIVIICTPYVLLTTVPSP